MKKSFVGTMMLLVLVLICGLFGSAFAETEEVYPEGFEFRFEGGIAEEDADLKNGSETAVAVTYGDGAADQGRQEFAGQYKEEAYMGTMDKIARRMVRLDDTKLVKVKGPCEVDVEISNPSVMSFSKAVKNEGALSRYGCTYYFQPAGTTGCSHVSFTTSVVGGKTSTFDFCFQEGPAYVLP